MKIVKKIIVLSFLLLLFLSCDIFSTERSIEIPMSDGIKLKAELWLPDLVGSFPVLLERTPYNRKEIIKMHRHLVDSGYAVLVQNLRGTVGSEGKWEVFGSDSWGGPGKQDGIDTVEWIKQQKWCNGKIGLMGFSASAISAQLLLASRPEGVQCAYLVAGSDNFYETIFPNGCYRKNTIEEWGPAKEYLPEIIKHPSYDEFWERRNARERAGQINVPVFIVGGWFDLFQRSSTEFFRLLNMNTNSPTFGKCKLIMHPLSHAANSGELVLEDRNKTNLDEKVGSMQEWFNYWLKEIDNGLYNKSAVGMYIIGDGQNPGEIGNTYQFYNNLPWSSNPVKMFLISGGNLSLETPTEEGNFSSYIYDPLDPTPSKGGNNLIPPSGPHDQREIEQRNDLLIFTSPPLKKHLTLIGPIKVHLYASTNVKDTDFGVRFCDVYPDGRSMLMNEGMVKARYRENIREEKFIEPGKIYEYEIDLWDTALVLAPEHRIRITIISASNPRYEPNPNTGEPFRQHTQTLKATQQIYHDKSHPSYILLPCIDTSDVLHDLF